MTHKLPRTFLGWVEVHSPAFTKPGFVNALIIMVGWIQTRGLTKEFWVMHLVLALITAQMLRG